MGTNFYWRDRPCSSCGRHDDEIHVGKRSRGWSFGFRGYRDANTSPTGFAVESRADWRLVFTKLAGDLFDEDGVQVPDPVAWLDALEAPSLEQQRREWSREWMGPHWDPNDPRDWRDPEGFRFHGEEFS